MQNNPLVSVIVPIFNTAEYLKKCVDSILAQTYTNLEIILVDDGSSDDSGAVCDEYAKQNAKIKVIHKQNGGLSSARNEGIRLASGEWIQFVDSDDYIASNMIEEMLFTAIKNDTLISICGRMDVEYESGEEKVSLCPFKNEVLFATECNARLMTWQGSDFSACDKIFHKSLWQDFEFPLGVHSEDIAVMYKVINKAKRISLINKPYYYYVHRKNSITTLKFNEKSFDFPNHTKAILEWVRKNCPSIENEARVMRIRAVSWILTLLAIEPKAVKEKYKKEYKAFQRELADNFKFWLSSKHLTKKQKLINILLYLRLYGIVYKIKRL